MEKPQFVLLLRSSLLADFKSANDDYKVLIRFVPEITAPNGTNVGLDNEGQLESLVILAASLMQHAKEFATKHGIPLERITKHCDDLMQAKFFNVHLTK